MKSIFKTLSICSFILNCLVGQFYSDLPREGIPHNLDIPLNEYSTNNMFSNKFNVNHGFSMSMISNGKSIYSVSGINNQISYQLHDKLVLNANVGLFMIQSPIQNENLALNQLSTSYDASITYKPTDNSFLQFRILNLPNHQKYQNYSPFNLRFNQ